MANHFVHTGDPDEPGFAWSGENSPHVQDPRIPPLDHPVFLPTSRQAFEAGAPKPEYLTSVIVPNAFPPPAAGSAPKAAALVEDGDRDPGGSGPRMTRQFQRR